MALAYAFDRAIVPRGLSFPMKRSVFDAALLDAGVSKIHCVDYWLRRSGHIIMRADFRGEGRRGWAAAGLASITVHAVPSSDRPVIEASIVSRVLPGMIGWLKELESSGNTRRGVDHHFVASWEACALDVETTKAAGLTSRCSGPAPRAADPGRQAARAVSLTEEPDEATALDPYHVAWLLLRAVSDFSYTQHGWLPARNFRFWYSVFIGLAFGGVWGAAVARDARSAIWEGAAAGLLGRLIIPLGDFIVE